MSTQPSEAIGQAFPLKVFKYRAIDEFLFDSLDNRRLYCAPACELNDPFDCQIAIENCLNRAIGATGDPARRSAIKTDLLPLAKTMETVLNKTGICSLSTQGLPPTLWAHYADNHRGLLIQFAIPEDFADSNPFWGAGVTYGDDALFHWLINDMDPKSPLDGFIDQYRLTKSEAWAHEAEFRFVGGAGSYINIPSPVVRGVCFGLRTSGADIAKVRQALERHYPHAVVAQMTRDHRSDFGYVPRRLP